MSSFEISYAAVRFLLLGMVTILSSSVSVAAAAAPPERPAYVSLGPNVSYTCGQSNRRLLDTRITADRITYIVSDPTTPPAGCRDNGVQVFPTPALPPGTYRVEVRDRSGIVVDLASIDETVTIRTTEPTQVVFTLFEPRTATHFVTANSADKTQLQSLGWQLVDDGFRVWPASGPAPDAAKSVCRYFYPTKATHFYSANPNDCAKLKSTAGFVDEGIAFRALVPIGGRCGLGTIPVYRLFDPERVNHRYTTNQDTVVSLVTSYLVQNDYGYPTRPDSRLSNAWYDEGIAFCSPTQ